MYKIGDNHIYPKYGHIVSKITTVWYLTQIASLSKLSWIQILLHHEIVSLISMNYRNPGPQTPKSPNLGFLQEPDSPTHWREKLRTVLHCRPGIYRGIAGWMFSFWKQDLDKNNHKGCWLYPFVMSISYSFWGPKNE